MNKQGEWGEAEGDIEKDSLPHLEDFWIRPCKIYIGNDKMVHAANTRTGVIISKVSYWEKYGGGHIATIRRV